MNNDNNNETPIIDGEEDHCDELEKEKEKKETKTSSQNQRRSWNTKSSSSSSASSSSSLQGRREQIHRNKQRSVTAAAATTTKTTNSQFNKTNKKQNNNNNNNNNSGNKKKKKTTVNSLFRQDNSNNKDGAIDSFLRGEYDRPFSEDAPAPHPGLEPGQAIDLALRALRALDDPEPSHGAAVFLRFCTPLSRGDRWGGGSVLDPWKDVLRGAITPTMLARRLRASSFSCLLDWDKLDVTEGLSVISMTSEPFVGIAPTVAYVSAAMFFGHGIEPQIVQFTLRKLGGVWLIDTALLSPMEQFIGDDIHDDDDDHDHHHS